MADYKSSLIDQMNANLSKGIGKITKLDGSRKQPKSKKSLLRKKYNDIIRKMRKTDDMDKFTSLRKEAEEIIKQMKELEKLHEMKKNLKTV